MRTLCVLLLVLMTVPAFGQAALQKETQELMAGLSQLQETVARLKKSSASGQLVADVEVYAKGVEWCLRHQEFYPAKDPKAPSAWIGYCRNALKNGAARAAEIEAGQPAWPKQIGGSVRGYVSRVDGSVQPYVVSLPKSFADARSGQRWPLHIHLHGRGGTRNEVRFFNELEHKPPKDDQTWIQLEIFGRTDNAYRYAGETDVFEALADLKRRYRIDEQRITLWGFSMGGAGAWHLGLHHPSLWSSVGPGAGFVDFYKYQKQTSPLPSYQHRALHIYDTVDYTLNLANVPLVTYGGELDAQLAASTTMVELAKELNVPVKLLVGPKTEHRFHPDSFQEFMAFHQEHSQKGRPAFPGLRKIRFVTWTLKYNRCEWLTIEELIEPYVETTVTGGLDTDGVLRSKTTNVAALNLSRDVADLVELDGDELPLRNSADDLLPDVYYVRDAQGWRVLNYDDSRGFMGNPEHRKRHNLQGPIDDAFMESFICVRGSGKPWSASHQAWADWTLARFEQEFDKWLRGRPQVIADTELTDEQIATSNLILFGDPGSNQVLARIYKSVPLRWTVNTLEVNDKAYDPAKHGVAMIYPNPLNPQRYVVINSGHTMHTPDFKASNAWLFPKLGDVAVLKFEPQSDGSFHESTVWAEIFDSSWKLPAR